MSYGDNLPEITLPSGAKARGVKVSVVNPPKVAFLGLPTNDQMLRWMGSQNPLVRKKTARRKKNPTTYTPNPAAYVELFNAIRLDQNGAPFDEAECGAALSKLLRAEVTSCEVTSEGFAIKMDTLFGEVRHTIKHPAEIDLAIYGQYSVSREDLPDGMEALRVPAAFQVQFYDSLYRRFEGYAATYTLRDIPPHHKRSAVGAVVNFLMDKEDAEKTRKRKGRR